MRIAEFGTKGSARQGGFSIPHSEIRIPKLVLHVWCSRDTACGVEATSTVGTGATGEPNPLIFAELYGYLAMAWVLQDLMSDPSKKKVDNDAR